MRQARLLFTLVACLILLQTAALLHSVKHLAADVEPQGDELVHLCTQCVATQAADLPVPAHSASLTAHVAEEARSLFSALWRYFPPAFFRPSRGPPFA